MRYAVTFLHQQAAEMNDPWAKGVLNCVAHGLGIEGKNQTIEVKAKLLEIAEVKAKLLKIAMALAADANERKGGVGYEPKNGPTSTREAGPV